MNSEDSLYICNIARECKVTFGCRHKKPHKHNLVCDSHCRDYNYGNCIPVQKVKL